MKDPIFFDVIKEVINIGVGEAAASLSSLLNNRVEIRFPEIRILSISEVDEFVVNEMEKLGVYMSQNFQGDFSGKTILFYNNECSIALLNAILDPDPPITSINDAGIATLNEIGNIIMGSCIAEIGNMTARRLRFTLPEVTMEISEIYFKNLLRDLFPYDQVIVVKNTIAIRNKDIEGFLFILLSFQEFENVIHALMESME